MKAYHNLPVTQRDIQRLVDEFNADERLWCSLRYARKWRRKILRRLAWKDRRVLDLLEFATLHSANDCIGEPLRRAK